MDSGGLSGLHSVLLRIAAQCENLGIQLWECQVTAFSQIWGDSSCGFGGIAGQAITAAYTVILETPKGAYIFINGRFAYDVRSPSDLFYEAMKDQKFPGKSEYRRRLYCKEDI